MNNKNIYYLNPSDVSIHPDAGIISEMISSEMDHLTESIKKYGQVESAKMLCGQLLDGRARKQACERLGLKLKVEDLPANTNPLTYIFTHNLVRRQVSFSQRAGIAVKFLDMMPEASLDDKVARVSKGCNVSKKYIYDCIEIRNASERAFQGICNASLTIEKARQQAI